MKEKRTGDRILVGKPEGMRLIERPKSRSKIILKFIFKEI
jgi:hypothetical protein